MKSILVATDFSENSTLAFKWALHLARRHGASVMVLHVAPVTTMTSLPLEIQGNIDRSLESLVDPGHDAGITCTTQWRTGKPWQVISDEARAHDLVVIGARGHTPLPHLPLGSTADRVLRTAPVPVLTVRLDDTAFDRSPRRVLVPTDFSELSTRALDAVKLVFAPTADRPLDLTLLHVWQPLLEYGDIYGGMPLPNPYVDSEEQARQLVESLAAKVAGEAIKVHPVVRPGYPVRVIREEVEVLKPELIALGTHGHSGLARFMLGSVAERVVHHATCPVLSVGVSSVEDEENAHDHVPAKAAT